MRGTDWKIVGTFTSGGSIQESELLAHADTMLSAYGSNAFNSARVLLASPEDLGVLRDALAANPDLRIDVKSEPDYYAELSQPLHRLLTWVAYVVGGIMATGALFAALNTMHCAVNSRLTEVITLRAIGFGAAAVASCVLFEAMLFALFGAIGGAGLSYVIFDGRTMSTIGGAIGASELAFSLAITPGIFLIGILLGLGIGLIGALLPAVYAARVRIGCNAGRY